MLIVTVVLPRPSNHSEASEEGEEGQEETPRGSGVRIQEERAGGADSEAALALWQHALAQRSDAPQWHTVTVHFTSNRFRHLVWISNGTNVGKMSVSDRELQLLVG